MLSVNREYAGRTVLLTGGLGYLGSVILEQLLRLTQVKKVYLLARGKKHLTAKQRVDKLLCSSLFNLLHKDVANGGPNVFSKVHAVEGDMAFPGLGLSTDDTQVLRHEVDIVLHCAASLELDAQIQKTIRSNYCSTAELLQLASAMPNLKSFVFTSTYFVNNFLPRNSVVREHLHNVPLTLGGKTLNHRQFVQAVLAMAPENADQQVAELMESLNFTSTYAFGKLLTEHLVDEAALKGVSKVVVRPSLISCIAGDPYPGFINNYAGSPGFMMSYAAGFFHNLSSMAYASDYILDLIPCDVAAALIIAAAAAGAAEAGPAAASPAKVFHAASAHSHPVKVDKAIAESAKFWTANPPPLTLPFTRYFTYTVHHEPTPWGVALGRCITQAKVWLLRKVLEWGGKERHAKALANSFKALCVQNSFRYNRSIVSSVDNALALRARLSADESSQWPVVWHKDLSMDWDTYGYTFLAGVRWLLFRKPGKVQLEHLDRACNFEFKHDAPPHVRDIILNSSSSNGTSLMESTKDVTPVHSCTGQDIGMDSGLTTAVSVGDGKGAALRAVGKQMVELSVTTGVVELVR